MLDNIIGKIFNSNNYGEFTVIDNCANGKFLCKFIETGYETVTTKVHILQGEVMDKFKPTNYSIGFLGNCNYPIDSKIKTVWKKMLERCYSDTCKSYPIYGGKGVYVCEHWHCFANFEKDFHKLPIFNNNHKLELDKDVINGEELCYSFENCCLIPRHINSFMRENVSKNGCGTIYINKLNKYMARITIECKSIYLGIYDNKRDAILAYLIRKYSRLLELLEDCESDKIKDGLIKKYNNLCLKYDIDIEEILSYKKGEL